MAYTVKYQLNSRPEARTDGYGVDHDISAIYSENGQTWTPVPGGHRTVVVPTADMETVMGMPHNNGANKNAKTAAYKQALIDNRNTAPVPIVAPELSDFDLDAFQEFLPLHAAYILELAGLQHSAETEAGKADAYITNTLNQPYPVAFSL